MGGGDQGEGLMAGGSSLAQAFNQPAPAAASGGYADQAFAGDVAKLAAQANISPQQLLAAAQQLAAQQPAATASAGFGTQPMMMMGGPAAMQPVSALDDLAAFSQVQQQAKVAANSPKAAPKKDGLDSLDALA